MQITKVTASTFPYDLSHDLYQEYYRRALRAACEERGIAYAERSNTRWEAGLLKVRSLRNSYKLRKLMQTAVGSALIDRVAGWMTHGPLKSPTGPGIYEVQTATGRTLTVCIDARDSGQMDEAMAVSSDVYFKSNYWPTRSYPANVIAAPNMNPLIGRDLAYFKSLRDTPKTTDLFAFFRVWGGDDEVAGIEHNLQLIESLAKVSCRKYLCAYLVAGDIAAIGKRLSEQGIDWTTEPMSKRELWERAAQSRLNVVRLGMHECSPWRMIDILAIGGCPVIDYGPQTVWPEPLGEGREYLNLHVAPGAQNFETVADKVTGWLADAALIERISGATAAYFDQHLAPPMLGKEMLALVEAHG